MWMSCRARLVPIASKMWIFLLLTSFLTANAGIIKKNCQGSVVYSIDGVIHEPEILKNNLDRPYLLTIDFQTNVVYFSYSLTGDEDSSKTANINLNTKEFRDVKGVNNGFAQTVDQNTHEVYIGGSDGIYKHKYENDYADFYAEKDINIWNLYFKDVLYFSVYPSQFLFTHSNGRTERFKDLEDTKVDNFVIDNDNVLFFTNATGLFSKGSGGMDAVMYQKFKEYGVRGLTTDKNGKVYACLQDGIYYVDKTTASMEKVLDIDDAFGIAFDGDNNLVYSDSSSIVILKANKQKMC